MSEPMKTTNSETVLLPLPPEVAQAHSQADEMKIYARFMRHLHCVPNSRDEIKALSAVQFTADMLNLSDAHVAKVLVELGLRAPRMAFPADFLAFADQALMRSGWEVGGPSRALSELKSFWDQAGEDKFAGFKGEYTLLSEDALF